MNNPLRLLHDECGLKLSALAIGLGCYGKNHVARKYMDAHRLPAKLHNNIMHMTLCYWGDKVREQSPVAPQLWECYFPDTEPHIYHVLVYVFGVDMYRLTSWSGFTERKIRKFLRQTKLTKRQLRPIAREATAYAEALLSPRSDDGTDPRGQIILDALKDPERIRSWNDLD